VLHGVHDHEPEHRDQNDHDQQRADERREAAQGPNSSRAIWPRLRPSRRVDRSRIVMSCTQPPRTAPAMIHSVPGR